MEAPRLLVDMGFGVLFGKFERFLQPYLGNEMTLTIILFLGRFRL